MVTSEFRCMKCGRIDVYGPTAKPIHCGQPMIAGDLGRIRDKDAVTIDLVRLKEPPEVQWMVPGEPEQVLEVWAFRPGREKGEKLGWVAEWSTGWEYKTVAGVPGGTGTSLTRNAAVEAVYMAVAG